jgi:hypothetical protein
MAVLYVSEHAELVVHQGGGGQALSEPPIVEDTVAIGGTSAQSDAFNAKTRFVRIHTDAICSILFGANPTATTANKRLAANQTEIFRVTPGDKVAVITNT